MASDRNSHSGAHDLSPTHADSAHSGRDAGADEWMRDAERFIDDEFRALEDMKTKVKDSGSRVTMKDVLNVYEEIEKGRGVIRRAIKVINHRTQGIARLTVANQAMAREVKKLKEQLRQSAGPSELTAIKRSATRTAESVAGFRSTGSRGGGGIKAGGAAKKTVKKPGAINPALRGSAVSELRRPASPAASDTGIRSRMSPRGRKIAGGGGGGPLSPAKKTVTGGTASSKAKAKTPVAAAGASGASSGSKVQRPRSSLGRANAEIASSGAGASTADSSVAGASAADGNGRSVSPSAESDPGFLRAPGRRGAGGAQSVVGVDTGRRRLDLSGRPRLAPRVRPAPASAAATDDDDDDDTSSVHSHAPAPSTLSADQKRRLSKKLMDIATKLKKKQTQLDWESRCAQMDTLQRLCVKYPRETVGDMIKLKTTIAYQLNFREPKIVQRACKLVIALAQAMRSALGAQSVHWVEPLFMVYVRPYEAESKPAEEALYALVNHCRSVLFLKELVPHVTDHKSDRVRVLCLDMISRFMEIEINVRQQHSGALEPDQPRERQLRGGKLVKHFPNICAAAVQRGNRGNKEEKDAARSVLSALGELDHELFTVAQQELPPAFMSAEPRLSRMRLAPLPSPSAGSGAAGAFDGLLGGRGFIEDDVRSSVSDQFSVDLNETA